MVLRPKHGCFSGRRCCIAILLIIAAFGTRSPAQGQGSWVNLTNGDQITSLGGHAGKIWATTNGGVVELGKATGLRTFYSHANSALPNNQPYSLHVESNGDLWVYMAVTLTG